MSKHALNTHNFHIIYFLPSIAIASLILMPVFSGLLCVAFPPPHWSQRQFVQSACFSTLMFLPVAVVVAEEPRFLMLLCCLFGSPTIVSVNASSAAVSRGWHG